MEEVVEREFLGVLVIEDLGQPLLEQTLAEVQHQDPLQTSKEYIINMPNIFNLLIRTNSHFYVFVPVGPLMTLWCPLPLYCIALH
jgi:hypothetical protein